MKTRNKTQPHWPLDADRVAIFLRQDLDVIPPKGEEQIYSKNERKKDMDIQVRNKWERLLVYGSAPWIRPDLKDMVSQK